MNEIGAKIRQLTETYTLQCRLYEQIGELGAEEHALIKGGHLDRLLELLRQKQTVLTEASECEAEISKIQEQLTAHFELTSFSLPRLKAAAAPRFQGDLAAMEQVVAKLIPVLERLEAQEKQNEQNLAKYLERSKAGRRQVDQTKRARRAYGSEKCDTH